MLTKIEVRNAVGQLMILPLESISNNGLFIADIQGLDPVKTTLVSTSYANLPGAQFQAAHRDPRNILLRLGLEPDYVLTSISDLRDHVYDFFMPESVISLRFFKANGLTVDIQARVESCPTNMFTKDPVVDISLMCYQPDFLALTSTVVNETPIGDDDEFTVNYPGTSRTGFKLTIPLTEDINDFTVYQRLPDNQVRSMDFAANLLDGDTVIIQTMMGNKFIFLSRASVLSSLLYAMSTQSPWLDLVKGENHFRVYAEGVSMPCSLEYTARYGGL
jgi:hypothetical protein